MILKYLIVGGAFWIFYFGTNGIQALIFNNFALSNLANGAIAIAVSLSQLIALAYASLNVVLITAKSLLEIEKYNEKDENIDPDDKTHSIDALIIEKESIEHGAKENTINDKFYSYQLEKTDKPKSKVKRRNKKHY